MWSIQLWKHNSVLHTNICMTNKSCLHSICACFCPHPYPLTSKNKETPSKKKPTCVYLYSCILVNCPNLCAEIFTTDRRHLQHSYYIEVVHVGQCKWCIVPFTHCVIQEYNGDLAGTSPYVGWMKYPYTVLRCMHVNQM